MDIIIKRWGNYINRVPNENLTLWISDNVQDEDGGKINVLMGRDKMLGIAEMQGYEFSIARVYPVLEKKGNAYVCKCEVCGGEMLISPRNGVFRCFKCGRNGNAMDYEEHIEQWKRDHNKSI